MDVSRENRGACPPLNVKKKNKKKFLENTQKKINA